MHRAVLLFSVPVLLSALEVDSSFQLRLLTPITSYSPAGASFKASIVGPLLRDGAPSLPLGLVVHGVVRKVKGVGLGLKRERAELDIEFTRCELPDGAALPCNVELQEIDNAREQMAGKNRIRGVLAASHANSWFSGVWYRPASGFLHRSAAGLTGASGLINARYASGPIGSAIVITSRLLLFRMPEPEIELPAGTELIVRIDTTAPAVDSNEVVGDELPEELVHWLSLQPSEVTQPDGKLAGDLINVILAGSLAQLKNAFTAAGWKEADPLTAKTFARTYAAFASMRAYSTSPVSPLFYSGRLPDLVFQKGFNSVAKRHHIRLWGGDSGGSQFWLGAATHDKSVAFDWGRMSFTHRSDPMIDIERSKVLNDLSFANCAIEAPALARPRLARTGTNGERIATDGAAAVAILQDCQDTSNGPAGLSRQRSKVRGFARRVILETRHYWTRGSAYYWGQRGVRWMASSLRGQR